MTRRADLIDELSADLTPARRLRSPLLLTSVWLAGSWLFVVFAMLSVWPFRPGFAEQLLSFPRFAAETFLGLAAVIIAAMVVFGLGVPGWGSTRRRASLALGLLLIWAAAYVYGLYAPALEPSAAGARPLCYVEVLLDGIPILLVGLLLLRRLAPLKRALSGAVFGAAAGSIPGLLMQLACMYVPAHILTYHLAPIVPLVLLGAFLGRMLLRRI